MFNYNTHSFSTQRGAKESFRENIQIQNMSSRQPALKNDSLQTESLGKYSLSSGQYKPHISCLPKHCRNKSLKICSNMIEQKSDGCNSMNLKTYNLTFQGSQEIKADKPEKIRTNNLEFLGS